MNTPIYPLDARLSGARSLPLEVGPERAAELLANAPAAGPVTRFRWWAGGGFVLLLLTLAVFRPVTDAPPLAAGFPVVAAALASVPPAAEPVPPIPLSAAIAAPAAAIAAPTPVIRPAPVTGLTAPEEASAEPTSLALITPVRNTKSPTAPPPIYAPAAEYGPVLLRGRYTREKDEMYLKVGPTEPVNQSLPFVYFDLSAAERELLDSPLPGYALDRATGRLELTPDDKNTGSFAFRAYLPLRERFEAAGWGTNALTDSTAGRYGVMASPGTVHRNLPTLDVPDPPVPALEWLNYFAAGVDEQYVRDLKGFGFVDSALQRLWLLPNRQITRNQLGELFQRGDRLLDDGPYGDLKLMVALDRFDEDTEKVLDRYGYLPLTEREALDLKPVSPEFIERINANQKQSFTSAEVRRLYQLDPQGERIEWLNDNWKKAATVDWISQVLKLQPSLKDLRQITRTTPEGYAELLCKQVEYRAATRTKMIDGGDLWVGADYARTGKRTRGVRMREFRRVVVGPNVRVVVQRGNHFAMHSAMQFEDAPGRRRFKWKNRGRVLELSVRQNWRVRIDGVPLVDVLLTVPDLELIEVEKLGWLYVEEKLELAVTGPGKRGQAIFANE